MCLTVLETSQKMIQIMVKACLIALAVQM